MDSTDLTTERTILNAAITCVNRWGVDRFSMADLAKEAAVARSTVYMYFKTRDEVIRAALLQSAYHFGEKIFAHQKRFEDSAERLVETVFFCVKQLPEEPFLAMISSSSLTDMVREHTLTTEAGVDISVALVTEMLALNHFSKRELREMSEFLMRFILSLITMGSPLIKNDDELKGFIARCALPVLKLAVPRKYQIDVSNN